jgi:hypothetical protein
MKHHQTLYSDQPESSGRWEVEDGMIRFALDERSAACEPGDTWAWDGTILEDGRLLTVTVEDGHEPCAIGVGSERTWVQIAES